MGYFVLTCAVFIVAIGINSASVYAQKHYGFYDRWHRGWTWHSIAILPAWILFVYLLVNLNRHYVLRFDAIPVIGYALFVLAAALFSLGLREIGWQSLTNGNWFGRGRISHSSIFKILKNPIYDSYFLSFIAAALAWGNAAYFIIALESYIGLNIVESRVEQIKENRQE